jgi:hypothetical protein
MVKTPTWPTSCGNWAGLWNVIRIVGTSLTQTVAAAPNVNVSGSVVVVSDKVVGGAVVDDDEFVGVDVDVVEVEEPGTVVDVEDEVVVGVDVVDVVDDVVVGTTLVVVVGSVVVVVDVVTSVVVVVVAPVVVVVGGQSNGSVTVAVAVSPMTR